MVFNETPLGSYVSTNVHKITLIKNILTFLTFTRELHPEPF